MCLIHNPEWLYVLHLSNYPPNHSLINIYGMPNMLFFYAFILVYYHIILMLFPNVPCFKYTHTKKDIHNECLAPSSSCSSRQLHPVCLDLGRGSNLHFSFRLLCTERQRIIALFLGSCHSQGRLRLSFGYWL